MPYMVLNEHLLALPLSDFKRNIQNRRKLVPEIFALVKKDLSPFDFESNRGSTNDCFVKALSPLGVTACPCDAALASMDAAFLSSDGELLIACPCLSLIHI